MANGPVQVGDIYEPTTFNAYVQQETERKSTLLQSGALARDAEADRMLQGGGRVFDLPSWQPLADDADVVVDDQPGNTITPQKLGTSQEVSVRLSRAQAWSSMDLSQALAGSDPVAAITQQIGTYWAYRAQAALVASLNGVFADNDANDSGDYTNDISGSSFVDGVTSFNAAAFIDAAVTMGDAAEDLGIVMVHSAVYARMKKNNLIDFIPDARGETTIRMFLGRVVVINDAMPNPSSGIYHTWLLGAGSLRWGIGSARVPSEVERKPDLGNGGGQEVVYSRVEWLLHPTGHAYTGTAPVGGPSNAATTNNLADAGSWDRVYPERKQIKIARLISRES